MALLTPSDFRAFWRHVHDSGSEPDEVGGPEPFPWQQRLVEEIAETGRWPDTIDVPTGLGKTTVLDVAVFTLALSMQPGAGLRLPRRTFLVIDRRIVVDQSFEHAERIGRALDEPRPGSVAERVAYLLRPVAVQRYDREDNGIDSPLVVGRMRGGTTWAWRWLQRPDQPAVIIGTIDQLGSRMLFDGYGVGETLRPIDAALTGSDSLVIVDEAHLAVPFMTTLRDAVRLGASAEALPVGPPTVVIMSATQPAGAKTAFQIDRAAELDNPVSSRRLLADKSLITVAAPISKSRRAADTGAALATVARCLGERFDVVGVVANTVATARAAFELLRTSADATEQCVLITGRQRTFERDVLLERWQPKITAGRQQQDGPLFVVATQTIEVGADLDFSALVTESASLDALVQRLGRLNRRGSWTGSIAAVVHPATVIDEDPIYGPARQATWSWLCEHVAPQGVPTKLALADLEAMLNVGPLALADVLPPADSRSALLMPNPRVPVLFPSVLDRWVRTSPRAIDTPPTGPFLHGIDRDVPAVGVVWRRVAGDGEVQAALRASVMVLPPSAAEIVEVPLWAAQAWLQGASDADVSDLSVVAGAVDEPSAEPTAEPTAKPFIAIGADGEPRTSLPLRAGDTVVVATQTGGLDEWGWYPASRAEVRDIADLVGQRRRTLLRLDRGIVLALMTDDRAKAAADAAFVVFDRSLESGEQPPDAARELLVAIHGAVASIEVADPYEARLGLVAEQLAADRHTKVVGIDDGAGGSVLLAHRPGLIDRWASDAGAAGTSVSGTAVTLDAHHRAVAARAEVFARSLELPDPIREAVMIAAAHHDVGKCDPRFQRMLNGGAVSPPVALAKSGMDPAQHWMFDRSRRLSGYPVGMRHEVFSARAVAASYSDHPERELIVHLVASHHGRARPLESAVADDVAVGYEVEVDGRTVVLRSDGFPDFGQPTRFRQLNERFGPWGLAMLETIVRLADIGCSSEGS